MITQSRVQSKLPKGLFVSHFHMEMKKNPNILHESKLVNFKHLCGYIDSHTEQTSAFISKHIDV